MVNGENSLQPIFGTIEKVNLSYAGSRFFDNVAFVTLGSNLKSRLFTLPTTSIEIECDNDELIVSWPDQLEVHYISIVSRFDVDVRMEGWADSLPIHSLQEKNVLVRNGPDTARIEIESDRILSLDDFRINVMATRASGGQYFPKYTPLNTFLTFSGGSALIDSFELFAGTSSAFKMDVGSKRAESVPDRVLYSFDLYGSSVNTWGEVTE